MINQSQVDRYAVFGNPIEQSRSPEIHQMFARQSGQSLTYGKILGQVGKFSASLERFFNDPDAKGCNITSPFKQDAANWVNDLSENAKACGAVNTIVRHDDGRFSGDNTDGKGLIYDLTKQEVSFLNTNVLLIGAGGAARGVVLPFLEQQVQSIDIVNRTKTKAQDLASWFARKNVTGLSFEELNQNNKNYHIIINCTSASLANELPNVGDYVLSNADMAYDMVYLPKPTVFMEHAARLGVKTTSDGLGMLVGQAAHSFKLWRGVMPDTHEVLNHLRASL